MEDNKTGSLSDLLIKSMMDQVDEVAEEMTEEESEEARKVADGESDFFSFMLTEVQDYISDMDPVQQMVFDSTLRAVKFAELEALETCFAILMTQKFTSGNPLDAIMVSATLDVCSEAQEKSNEGSTSDQESSAEEGVRGIPAGKVPNCS